MKKEKKKRPYRSSADTKIKKLEGEKKLAIGFNVKHQALKIRVVKNQRCLNLFNLAHSFQIHITLIPSDITDVELVKSINE